VGYTPLSGLCFGIKNSSRVSFYKGAIGIEVNSFQGPYRKLPIAGGPLRIPLAEHDDEEVELLWRQLHGIDPVVTEEIFLDCTGLDVHKKSEEVFRLTAIAHKYDVTGEDPLEHFHQHPKHSFTFSLPGCLDFGTLGVILLHTRVQILVTCMYCVRPTSYNYHVD
jgi:hypothetical protein